MRASEPPATYAAAAGATAGPSRGGLATPQSRPYTANPITHTLDDGLRPGSSMPSRAGSTLGVAHGPSGRCGKLRTHMCFGSGGLGQGVQVLGPGCGWGVCVCAPCVFACVRVCLCIVRDCACGCARACLCTCALACLHTHLCVGTHGWLHVQSLFLCVCVSVCVSVCVFVGERGPGSLGKCSCCVGALYPACAGW